METNSNTPLATVEDLYSIDIDEIYIRKQQGSGGDYWKAVEKFWEQVKSRGAETLTDKQKSWLDKIVRELEKETAR